MRWRKDARKSMAVRGTGGYLGKYEEALSAAEGLIEVLTAQTQRLTDENNRLTAEIERTR